MPLPNASAAQKTGLRVDANSLTNKDPVVGSRIGNDKRPRVYECYWAHFAAEIQLSE